MAFKYGMPVLNGYQDEMLGLMALLRNWTIIKNQVLNSRIETCATKG